MNKVYIAAPLRDYETALMLKNKLAGRCEVVSTWHDEAKELDDKAALREPRKRAERQAIVQGCLDNVDKCDFLVFTAGMYQPRCALVELGYALAKGKRVIFYGAPPNVADSHENSVSTGKFSQLCRLVSGEDSFDLYKVDNE